MAKAPAAALKSDPPAPEANAAAAPPAGVEAPIAASAAPVARRVPPIPARDFDLKEQRNPGYWLILEPFYTIEDLLADSSIWANVAGSGKLRPWSTMEVHWKDGSQFAEFYIRECGRTWAVVKLLRHVTLGEYVRPAQAHQFRVHFNGPVDNWRVLNVSNNTTLKAGFGTEASAQQFLAEHLKKIGG